MWFPFSTAQISRLSKTITGKHTYLTYHIGKSSANVDSTEFHSSTNTFRVWVLIRICASSNPYSQFHNHLSSQQSAIGWFHDTQLMLCIVFWLGDSEIGKCNSVVPHARWSSIFAAPADKFRGIMNIAFVSEETCLSVWNSYTDYLTNMAWWCSTKCAICVFVVESRSVGLRPWFSNVYLHLRGLPLFTLTHTLTCYMQL